MTLDEIINKNKQLLNQTDMVIVKYILNNRNQMRHISIHDLAKKCCVSSTTVVRFAQKLGFDGFSDLKALLKRESSVQEIKSQDILLSLEKFYTKTGANLMKRNYDNASRLIHEAHRVFAFASGYVQGNVLQELKRLFFYDNVFICEIKGREEFHSILHTLTADDLFIFISLSGETPIVVEFAKQLNLRGVPFISITKLHENTLASLSTVNLYISAADFQIHDEEVTTVSFKSMLPYFMLVEVWYFKYRIWLGNKNNFD